MFLILWTEMIYDFWKEAFFFFPFSFCFFFSLIKGDFNFGCFSLQSSNRHFSILAFQIWFLSGGFLFFCLFFNSLVLEFCQEEKKKGLLILVVCFLLREGLERWEASNTEVKQIHSLHMYWGNRCVCTSLEIHI